MDAVPRQYFKEGAYSDAIKGYSDILDKLTDDNLTQKAALLFNRAACFLKLKNYEKVIDDCTKVLELQPEHSRAHQRRLKALCCANKLDRALDAAQFWRTHHPKCEEAKRELQRLKRLVAQLNETEAAGESDSSSDASESSGGSTPTPDAKVYRPLSDDVFAQPLLDTVPDALQPTCVFCNVTFESNAALTRHCATATHKRQLLNDTGQRWKCRPPPSQSNPEQLSICVLRGTGQRCSLGDNCTFAHSREELNEWRRRLEVRRERIHSARELHLHVRSYGEQLMERWLSALNRRQVMTEELPGVSVSCSSQLSAHVRRKNSNSNWVFTLVTKGQRLQHVALIEDSTARNFSITSLAEGPRRRQRHMTLKPGATEWSPSEKTPPLEKKIPETVYRVKITFRSEVYGKFYQTVAFDFGQDPVLVQKISVECRPEVSLDNLEQELVSAQGQKWDPSSVNIVKINPVGTLMQRSKFDQQLLDCYPPPKAAEIVSKLSAGAEQLNEQNYKQRMHNLLYMEEIAQETKIATFNIRSTMQPVNSFMLVPGTYNSAKYATDGELFGKVQLDAELSEDSSAGRLILQGVQTCYICKHTEDGSSPETVYEAVLEEKARGFVFLRLSKSCVDGLSLSIDTYCKIQVQFQLNRLPFCEMHYAVDKLKNPNWLFAKHESSLNFKEASLPIEGHMLSSELNQRQRMVIQLLLLKSPQAWPSPVVLAGPYGTGKTFTMAEAARAILASPKTRVLICTHSNSAADLYIVSHFHARVQRGEEHLRPLRVYYKHRWLRTVPVDVLPYCLKQNDSFVEPTEADLKKHRIVVTTLSTTKYLLSLNLPKDFFTHILLDEAAQALEPEALLPLCLAGPHTRLCVAGDHLQLSPVIHSDLCKEYKLDVTLLERLYHALPDFFPGRIMLTENYRSHPDIVHLTSDLFYDLKLSSGNNTLTAHPNFFPVTMCVAKGEEKKHENCAGYFNLAEISEIVDRILELKRTWPTEWGPLEEGIGVVSPYTEQVFAIRSELRKRELYGIAVERVHNVQGKQFRVLLLSTVRTRLPEEREMPISSPTLDSSDGNVESHLGFLSDQKLLTTALTRAQNLVMIVGDPLVLCTVGKCRRLWERVLERCGEVDAIHGQTWNSLRSALAGRQLREVYKLNPLAPEFVPVSSTEVTEPPADESFASPDAVPIVLRSFRMPSFPIRPLVTGPVPRVGLGGPLMPHLSVAHFNRFPRIQHPVHARIFAYVFPGSVPRLVYTNPLQLVASNHSPSVGTSSPVLAAERGSPAQSFANLREASTRLTALQSESQSTPIDPRNSQLHQGGASAVPHEVPVRRDQSPLHTSVASSSLFNPSASEQLQPRFSLCGSSDEERLKQRGIGTKEESTKSTLQTSSEHNVSVEQSTLRWNEKRTAMPKTSKTSKLTSGSSTPQAGERALLMTPTSSSRMLFDQSNWLGAQETKSSRTLEASDNESLPEWAGEGESYDEEENMACVDALKIVDSPEKAEHLPLFLRSASYTDENRTSSDEMRAAQWRAQAPVPEPLPELLLNTSESSNLSGMEQRSQLQFLEQQFHQLPQSLPPLLRRRRASGGRGGGNYNAPNLRLVTDFGSRLPARPHSPEPILQPVPGTPMTPSGFYESERNKPMELLPDDLLESDPESDHDPLEMLRSLNVSDKQYQALYTYFK